MGETAGGRTWTWVQTALRGLFDLVFPPICAGCQTAGAVWCPECEGRRLRQSHLVCTDCGHPHGQPHQVLCRDCAAAGFGPHTITLGRYLPPLQNAIVQLKYRPDRTLAAALAQPMAAAVAEIGWKPTIVAAVPLHPTRERRRGFNQAELLADALARELGLGGALAVIRRTRNTPSQVGLNRQQRHDNMLHAFAADPSGLEAAHLLLVDDLRTTGATLGACAAAAAAAGAARVSAITLAATAAGRSRHRHR